MTRVVLGLGSNINRDNNLRFAVKKIIKRFGETKISPVYEAASVGFEGPSFINLVLGLYSGEPLLEIRDYLRGIETQAGRLRGKKSFDNRVLDIDVVLYGDANLRLGGINVPRDEIERYAYLLKPLSELYPEMTHPISGLTFAKMWMDFDHPEQFLKKVDFRF